MHNNTLNPISTPHSPGFNNCFYRLVFYKRWNLKFFYGDYMGAVRNHLSYFGGHNGNFTLYKNPKKGRETNFFV